MHRRMTAFEYWMRTGIGPDGEPAQYKFNPWHDPDDGRFTFANQGNYFGGSAAARRTPRAAPAPKSSSSSRAQPQKVGASRREVAPSRPLGSLSQRFESSGKEDPGIVSSGRGDPGGVSYGPWQMATNRGTPAAFLASREGQAWAKSFGSAKPGTPEFTKVWKALGAKHRDKFLESQRAFITRKYFDNTVSFLERISEIEFRSSSSAVKNVIYSRSVQHGDKSPIFEEVISRVNAKFKSGVIVYSYDWERTFIDEFYKESAAIRRDGAMKWFPRANRSWYPGLQNRFREERALALQWLKEEHGR